MSSAEYFSEIVCSRNLPAYLKSNCHSLSSNTYESRTQVVQILPAHLESSTKVRRLNCFSSNDDFASIYLARGNKRLFIHLLFSTHYSSHCCFDTSNEVILACSIIIYHLKLKILLFFRRSMEP